MLQGGGDQPDHPGAVGLNREFAGTGADHLWRVCRHRGGRRHPPTAPGTASQVALAPPPATAPGGVAYAEPGAARTQLAGTWKYGWDNGQKSCNVTLSTDRGMSGFAATADVDCPNDIFMTKGWDVWGNEIVLQNHVGKVTARLQPAGTGQYDGVATGDGAKVTLTRS
ncbi:protease inhibitor Inh/omp19 family protein [Ancylobacter dichloromethanicus]